MMELEVVKRSSQIQRTGEALSVRLKMRELDGSSLRRGSKASQLLQVVRQGARRPQTGTEGDWPFQAETVGGGRLQAGMEGVWRSKLRGREHSVSRPGLRKLGFPRLREEMVGPDPGFDGGSSAALDLAGGSSTAPT